jgi:hypothetical protein
MRLDMIVRENEIYEMNCGENEIMKIKIKVSLFKNN